MLKKIIIIFLMILYLYSLSFGIFLTDFFRIPAPFIFCAPLIVFFRYKNIPFLYRWEVMFFVFAVFLYNIIGMFDVQSFFTTIFKIIICAIYFNYFIGYNKSRFNVSVAIFYALLFVSAIIMVFDHVNPFQGKVIRELLLNEEIKQSPSGLAATQFTFGYQLAALVSFIFISTCVFKKNFLIQVLVLFICLIFMYLGMNRSVFITFICSVTLFLLFYYRFKSVLILGVSLLVGVVFYSYVIKDNFDSKNNILAKNEADGNYYNRASMAEENLKIYSDYPYGLIFYGKTWEDVTYRNNIFTFGLSSHNAYLMFITYLGPFLGLGLLFAIYFKISQVFKDVLYKIRLEENALLVCLCFSFLATSINALSHNAWLVGADGPTIFLYFGILHLVKLQRNQKLLEQSGVIVE